MKKVLFVCTGNAARSQMAESIFNHYAKDLFPFLGREFDYVITLCDSARAKCPIFPTRGVRLHWELPDPVRVEGKEKRLEVFRQVRDEIQRRILALLEEMNEKSRN